MVPPSELDMELQHNRSFLTNILGSDDNYAPETLEDRLESTVSALRKYPKDSVVTEGLKNDVTIMLCLKALLENK